MASPEAHVIQRLGEKSLIYRVNTDEKAFDFRNETISATANFTDRQRTTVARRIIFGVASPRSPWSDTAKTFSLMLLPSLSQQGLTAADITKSYLTAYKMLSEQEAPAENFFWFLAAGWTLAPDLVSNKKSAKRVFEICNTLVQSEEPEFAESSISQRAHRLKDKFALTYFEQFDTEKSELYKRIYFLRNSMKNSTNDEIAEAAGVPERKVRAIIGELIGYGIVEWKKSRLINEATHRRNEIPKMLRRNPNLTAHELAREFNVLPGAIRNDINVLIREGRIQNKLMLGRAVHRRSQIAEALTENPQPTYAELAARFHVTPVTISRDIRIIRAMRKKEIANRRTKIVLRLMLAPKTKPRELAANLGISLNNLYEDFNALTNEGRMPVKRSVKAGVVSEWIVFEVESTKTKKPQWPKPQLSAEFENLLPLKKMQATKTLKKT